MPGNGTELATTRNNPPSARLLDLTRSLRRAGRVATGIDRVERAYFDYLLQGDLPLFGLLRTRLGYLLLDRDGLSAFHDEMAGGAPCREADLRRLARARTVPWGLARMFRQHLPPGTAYLNVGHSNLTHRVLKAAAGMQVTAMIHDIIPLEHPQFQRPGTVEDFARKLDLVRHHADLVIYNSRDTRTRAEARMAAGGHAPAGVIAHLGVEPASPDPGMRVPIEPYFVTIGTIEPRKNHAFLLDLWERMGPNAPLLLICGARGWNNDAVFRRLDRLGPEARVKEMAGLADGALSALMAGASGLLFPSHAEGFGLPAAEALTLGTPVLCNTLSTFREIVGDNAQYASINDEGKWIATIEAWAARSRGDGEPVKFNPPTWADHFNKVLRLT